MIELFLTPQALFGDYYSRVIEMMSVHSPFPAAQGPGFGSHARMRAAVIHAEETVFFAEIAYRDLQPVDTVELCAGFGIPSITLRKQYGVHTLCVDSDSDKMQIGSDIAALIGVTLEQERADLFSYLRKHAPALTGKTLLATAAYCRDKKKGRPIGTGEKDIVKFARDHRINLALLPFRSGEVLRSGVSSEQKRIDEYQNLLSAAGYVTQRHSTRQLPSTRGAPEWFFLDILTAHCT
ncbi:MAG TPA: hypothetical protein PKJ77_06815 [Thermodesulfobacteriota bacterium]|nr:hypothetical protein [Thermodesulfobacteriota bacterium]